MNKEEALALHQQKSIEIFVKAGNCLESHTAIKIPSYYYFPFRRLV
jgi:nitrate reductase gamma subunit